MALLITIMAVMEGFQRDLRDRLRGSLADIVIRPRVPEPLASLLARARATPGVAAATPRVITSGLIKTPRAYVPVQLMAVDPVGEAAVSDYDLFTAAAPLAEARAHLETRVENSVPYLAPGGVAAWQALLVVAKTRSPADMAAHLQAERSALIDYVRADLRKDAARLVDASIADFTAAADVAAAAAVRLPLPDGPFRPGEPVPVQLGAELAIDLDTPGPRRGGSDLELLTARVDADGHIDEAASKEPIALRRSGRFRSGQFDLDSHLALLPLEAAWGRIVPVGTVSEVAVKVAPGASLPDVEAALTAAFPAADVLTWMAQRRSLLRAVRLEKGFLGALFMVFTVCLGFVMFVTFFNMVRQKRRDIGLLRAMGGGRLGAAAIFVGCALLIGGVGSAAGCLVGMWGVDHINWINSWANIFPRDLYYMEQIPTVLDFETVAWVVGTTLGLTVLLGGCIPAWRAARLDPVEALRYE